MLTGETPSPTGTASLTSSSTAGIEAALALRFPCIGFWGPRAVLLDTETGDLSMDEWVPPPRRTALLGPVWHWLPSGKLLFSFYQECLS